MYLETSNITKKIIGRLDVGKALMSSLVDACRAHAIGSGTVQLYGSFSAIDLVAYRKGGESVSMFSGEGDFTIVSFDGTISMFGNEIVFDARCVVLAEGPLGPQIIGGVVKDATIKSVDLVISGFDDILIERKADLDAGRFTIDAFRKKSVSKEIGISTKSDSSPRVEKEVEEKSTTSFPDQSEISWEDAAEVVSTSKPKKRLIPRHERLAKIKDQDISEIEIEEDLSLTAPELSAGDLLLHPKLGECRVMKVEGGDFARVRLPKGQLRKLSLAICSTEYVEKKNGRNVFKVRIN